MKETTKKRLIKVAKGVGFGVLGLFATIGIVATIASLCATGAKSEANPTRVALRQRRDAPIFDESANVFVGDNYFFDEHAFYGIDSNNIMTISRYSTTGDFGVSAGVIRRAGLYWYDIPSTTGGNIVVRGNGAFFSAVKSIAYASSVAIDLTSSSYGATVLWGGTGRRTGYLYVSEAQATAGYALTSRYSLGEYPMRMYAIDMLQAPASDYVSLPENWKPYNLVDLQPNANGFGTASKRSGASLSPLGYGLIDGMLFRSNGELYNRVEVLPWTPFTGGSGTEAHTFGYYDATGSLAYKAMHLAPDDGLILWQIRFTFVLADLPNYMGSVASRTDVVARCPQLDGVQIEGETRTIYLSGGALAWDSPLFRELEVLDVYKTDVRPTDALMARNPLEWLRLSLASVSPTPSGDVTIGDGMTLVSDGLTAIVPVLGIEVLPSVSLGLLLMLPLIGGIIVLIVKVFSK